MKCVSDCTKLNEQTCALPYCKYVNGEKRKYCGLNSSKYKMTPPDCAVTRKVGSVKPDSPPIKLEIKPEVKPEIKPKVKPKVKPEVKPEIKSEVKPEIKPEVKPEIKPEVKPKVKPVKTKKNKVTRVTTVKDHDIIKRFIKKSSLFLKTICLHPSNCLAFGKSTGEIKQFFNFTSFDHVVSPVKSIGEVSANGFVKEIKYSRQGYDAYAILKSTKNAKLDNLVYEGLVGTKFVNRVNPSFPCFIETYATYYYDNDKSWKEIQKGDMDKNILTHLQLQRSIDYAKSCKQSKYAALLLQHIKNATSVSQYLTKLKTYDTFLVNDAIYLLFIIYQALSSLSTEFTHNDLHPGNVLYIPLDPGKYMEYHYHHEDGTTTQFLFSGIPKMIDYGRSFFDNQHVSSKEVYDQVCKEPKCNPDCGLKVGYGYLDNHPNIQRLHGHASAQRKNESIDLRLFNEIKGLLTALNTLPERKPTTPGFKELEKMSKRIVYNVSISNLAMNTGTIENLTRGKNEIFNVTDAYLQLKRAIETPEIMDENRAHYATQIKVANLHVYHDRRPMVFERV